MVFAVFRSTIMAAQTKLFMSNETLLRLHRQCWEYASYAWWNIRAFHDASHFVSAHLCIIVYSNRNALGATDLRRIYPHPFWYDQIGRNMRYKHLSLYIQQKTQKILKPEDLSWMASRNIRPQEWSRPTSYNFYDQSSKLILNLIQFTWWFDVFEPDHFKSLKCSVFIA